MSDLTAKEQGHVRVALRFLRTRRGAESLAKVLKADRASVRRVTAGNDAVSTLR